MQIYFRIHFIFCVHYCCIAASFGQKSWFIVSFTFHNFDLKFSKSNRQISVKSVVLKNKEYIPTSAIIHSLFRKSWLPSLQFLLLSFKHLKFLNFSFTYAKVSKSITNANFSTSNKISYDFTTILILKYSSSKMFQKNSMENFLHLFPPNHFSVLIKI